ncbi:MAG: hypothetical protein ACI8P0_005822 [Planctomycetaceae bacterium]|jgi:hypothetical protein
MSLENVHDLQGNPTRTRRLSILLLCLSAGMICGCRGEITRRDDPNWKPLFTFMRVVAANPACAIGRTVSLRWFVLGSMKLTENVDNGFGIAVSENNDGWGLNN